MKAQFLLTVEVDDEEHVEDLHAAVETLLMEILPSVIDDEGDDVDAQWTLERVSTRLKIGRAVR